uniref:Uncharacterized protein n=1 Tax=Coturnix japonica TaxID=93934 RepID=A0A8C2T7I3_COTJA
MCNFRSVVSMSKILSGVRISTKRIDGHVSEMEVGAVRSGFFLMHGRSLTVNLQTYDKVIRWGEEKKKACRISNLNRSESQDMSKKKA